MSGSHFVEAGDTLGGIAEKYGLQLEDLARWNKDNPNLSVGQKVALSGHAADDQIYVVQPGDTVSGIAEKFGLRWVDIGAANQLEDINRIFAGQELIIPAQGVARGPAS